MVVKLHTARALFRFGVVSQVKARVLSGMDLAKAISEVASLPQVDTKGKTQGVAKSTLYRWYSKYQQRNVEALEDAVRNRRATSKALSEQFISFLKTEKEADQEASVPEIIRRARERNILGNSEEVSRSTVYRACLELNLPLLRQAGKKHSEMRRFSYPHRMQMVLCDGKHFRAGASRKKRVAFFFLDDSTRYVLHVVVGTSETKELFLRGLFETIERYGLMITLYVDNGSGFIAHWAIEIAANIGISLIHGTAGYPEGHGKIERFNQTVDGDLLSRLDNNPRIDPACPALELRLQHYLQQQYNPRPHESLEQKSPADCFNNDSRPLQFPESIDVLRDKFVIAETKKVSRDNVIRIDGDLYEVPLGYAGKRITVQRYVLEQRSAVKHEGKLITLKQLDPHLNAVMRRTPRRKKPGSATPPPRSAAELSFDKHFQPLVSADGSYPKKEDT